MSTTQNCCFVKLKDPPFVQHFIGKPQYVWNDCSNYMFMATGSDTKNGGIWKYDLDQQIIVTKYEYPRGINIEDPSIEIDIKNQIIYINALIDDHRLISFDLKCKKWNMSLYSDDDDLPNIIFIPSPVNELHLTMNDTHFRFDKNRNKPLIKLHSKIGILRDMEWWDNEAHFVYNTKEKQLMMIQSYCDYILICNINHRNQQSFEWKKYSTKLPQKTKQFYSFNIILGWNQILFLFEFTANDVGNIWCLDLLHNDKWFKSIYFVPTVLKYGSFVIKDKQNNIHCMRLRDSVHFKATLYDILPSQITKLNKKKYDPLVIGYIKQYEKDDQFPFIPVYLKQLILDFYPIFT